MKLGTLGRREKLLLGILALMAPIAGWRYLEPVIADLGGRGGAGIERVRSVEPRPVARQEIARLHLEALELPGGEYEPGRNLFRFGEKPKPPPPPPPPIVRVEAPPPPQQPPKPQPPPVDVELMGIFGPERRRIAVLRDPEGTIINALDQDEIREKFIVDRIGLESVDLKFIGFPDVEPERLKLGK